MDLTCATKTLIQKYEEMKEFSDVREIISRVAKDDVGERSQVDVLLSVLRLMDQQQTEKRIENAKLAEKLKRFENEQILLNLSQSTKMFDVRRERIKSAESKRQIEELSKQLKALGFADTF